jgi:uncharacterized MAPEG superfamily protein
MQAASVPLDTVAVLAATSVALQLKGTVLSYLQVRARFRSRRFGRPEDARLMRVEPASEPEIVRRIAAAWRNESESGPSFLALSASFALLGGSASALLPISIAFLIGRLGQAVSEILVLQPQRTLFYLLGLGASLTLAGFVAARVVEVLN